MTSMPMIDVVGFWLGIFLTFAILSFLYKDNPFYKLAEHLFIGVSVGYVVVRQVIDVLIPKLFTPLSTAESAAAYLLAGAPIALAVMMFFKLSKRHGWIGRYPVVFVVAFYAGLQVNSVPNGDLVKQLAPATKSVVAYKLNLNQATVDELVQLPGITPTVASKIVEARAQSPIESIARLPRLASLTPSESLEIEQAFGALQGLEARATTSTQPGYYWFGIFSNVLMLLGLVAGLVYFYFSVAHTGPVGKVSRFGVWILMIGFGASFGYTVQGRLSLAIGRAMDVLGLDKSPVVADQIRGTSVAVVAIVLIVVGLVIWERRSASPQE